MDLIIERQRDEQACMELWEKGVGEKKDCAVTVGREVEAVRVLKFAEEPDQAAGGTNRGKRSSVVLALNRDLCVLWLAFFQPPAVIGFGCSETRMPW